jgi:hypothetical protein
MIQVGDIVSYKYRLFEIIKSEIRYEKIVLIGKGITHSRRYTFYLDSIQKLKLIQKKETISCKLN